MLRASAVAIAIVLFLLPSCRSEGLRHAEYLYDFEGLAQMVATSDAVIEGTVVEIADGPTVVVDTDDVTQYTNVTITVDQVLSGTLNDSATKVTVVELPSVELPLTPADDHGFFFLYWDKSDQAYTLIGPQGRFMVDEKGLMDSTAPKSAWITSLEGLTVLQFREDLDQAISQAAEGSVSPAEPVVGID